MRAALTSLIAAVLVVPLFAQQTNRVVLSVDALTSYTPRRPGSGPLPIHTRVTYFVSVVSDGLVTRDTDILLDVPGNVISINASPQIGCSDVHTRPILCRVAVPDAFHLDGWIHVSTSLDTAGTHTAFFRTGDQEVRRTFDVVDQPSISVGAQANTFFSLEPRQAFQYKSFLSSQGGTATNVRLTLTLLQGGTFTAARPSDPETQCTVSPQEVVCTRATLPHGLAVITELDVIAPDRLTGGSVVLRVEDTKNEPDIDPEDDVSVISSRLTRHLVVSNTNDEGGGSLRQALLESHVLCATEPCAIVFAIPATRENEVFEIRPQSQLPVVRGIVRLDGATQQNGRVVLNGAEAGASHGLVLGPGCEIQVLGLTITGFTWPGIQAQTLPLQSCGIYFPKVHPSVLIAGNTISNNYRGVMLVDSAEIGIRDNVITGNRRSGIYAERTFYVEVTGNSITGNGAAGMFLDTGTRGAWNSGGAVVTDNLIAANTEWGITRTNNGELQIQRNSIFGNPHPAIDLNLDFETPNRPHEDLSTIPNKPVLLSAFYDPAREGTVVTVRLDNDSGYPYQLDFYANDPAGVSPQWQMQEWVAMEQLPGYSIHREITITIPRDLRGRLLVATMSRGRFTSFAKPPDVSSQSHQRYTAFDTSEPSNAIPVQ